MHSTFAFASVLLVSAIPAFAQTTILVPSGEATIQRGLDAALNGDTVLVAPGTYFEHDLDFAGKSVVLRAEGAPENTVIDAAGAGRVVIFDDGEPASARLEGFTLRNGRAPDGVSGSGTQSGTSGSDGGGVLIIGSSPTLDNLLIELCRAGDGGSGGSVAGAAPGGNGANSGSGADGGHGGGVYVASGSPRLSALEFRMCRAGDGGAGGTGGAGHDGDPFGQKNGGDGSSGGAGGDGGSGGALALADGDVRLVNCLAYDCESGAGGAGGSGGGGGEGAGAGIGSNGGDGGDGGNAADGGSAGSGAAFHSSGGQLELLHVTAARNKVRELGAAGSAGSAGMGVPSTGFGAPGSDGVAGMPAFAGAAGIGSAVALESGTAAITNSILVTEDLSQPAPIGLGMLAFFNVRFSLVEGGFLGVGNFDAPPGFVDPSQGDFHLASGSACLDAGTSFLIALPTFDIDGEPRIIGSNVDVGADERFGLPGTGEDCAITTEVNAEANLGAALKFASAGDSFEVHVSSPGEAFVGSIPFLGYQSYSTGSVLAPDPFFAGVWLNQLEPSLGLVPMVPSTILGPGLLSTSGAIASFTIPAGLEGLTIRWQGILVEPTLAANGLFAATDAHDLQID